MLLSTEILLILKITLPNAKNALHFLKRTFRMQWASLRSAYLLRSEFQKIIQTLFLFLVYAYIPFKCL